MAAVEYGTIGIRPMGNYNPNTKYGFLHLVDYDGSSYVAHTDPPLGSLPTDTNYWQVSALGTSKATANSVGTVKPDGTTTEVSADGSLSVKTATQNALGLVKGSNGIKVGTDGSIDVNTLFEQATELANIIAEEAISSVLGKISKAIAVTIGLNENALLKNMLTNMDANDNTKINTAAFIHTLYERIGMGTELTAGANLTAVVEALNSNLTLNYLPDGTDINTLTKTGKYRVLNGVNNPLSNSTDGDVLVLTQKIWDTTIYQKIISLWGSRKTVERLLVNGAWQNMSNTDSGKKVTLADTGVFHITRQSVMEYPDYYAVALTITPTATPATDTPMLTFPKQLATCVLPITTGYAGGLTYASNNNQMFYRLLTGTINNTTEVIINGIIPKA